MNKKQFALYLLVLSLTTLFWVPEQLKATHVAGADITYTYISGNQYLVQVRFFRDCNGIFAPATLDVCYHSVSCNLSATSTLVMLPNFIELPLCPYLPPVITACQGGAGYGIERYTYQGVVTFPFACNDWILSYTAPLINGGFPFSSPLPNFIVTTKIDNLNFPVNSSVNFLTDPLFQFCIAQLGYESFAASDIDGDSLRYEIIPTSADSFFCPPQPVPPSPGSYLFQPLSSTPWYIHPDDGWLNFTPSMIQVGHINVKVLEYRQGQLINETVISHMVSSVGGCIATPVDETINAETDIYPNPVSDQLTVNMPVAGMLQIFSVSGQLVYYEANAEVTPRVSQIDVSNFPPGIYCLVISDGNALSNKMFVKN